MMELSYRRHRFPSVTKTAGANDRADADGEPRTAAALLALMSDAGDPVGAETDGDVPPFSDNPDIRKRFGIKQDTARRTTVSF
jgi:hypothetical protein